MRNVKRLTDIYCSNDLSLIVSPRTELERADLVVERKQRDVDLTRAAESGGRRPEHSAV